MLAIIAGFFLYSYDQRTDDTGVEAALLFAISMALAVAVPKRWFAVALGVGLPITLFTGVFIALLIPLAGAFLGNVMRQARVPR